MAGKKGGGSRKGGMKTRFVMGLGKKKKAPEKKEQKGVSEKRMTEITKQGKKVRTEVTPAEAGLGNAKELVEGIKTRALDSNKGLTEYMDKTVENRGDFTPEQWKEIEALNKEIQGDHTRTMDEIIETTKALEEYKETFDPGSKEAGEVEGALGDILRTQDAVTKSQIMFNSHVGELGTPAQVVEPMDTLPTRFKGAFGKAFGVVKKIPGAVRTVPGKARATKNVFMGLFTARGKRKPKGIGV